jgi:DNA-binding response OmpR family regulator
MHGDELAHHRGDRLVARRPLLLLVEDEPTISVALGRLLDRWDFDTVPARTAEEAQTILASTEVDLIVIDFRLPDMRGDELYRWIGREYPALERRTMFITGDFGEQALIAIEATGRPSLLKPFELGIFVHELRSLLDPLGPGSNGHGAVHPPVDASAA